MNFLLLALSLVAAVSNCQADTVDELIHTANNAGAPFTQKALMRLHNSDRWGVKRANRTSDIVFMNACGRAFKLVAGKCVDSSFSFGLYPEVRVHEFSSTVWGIESNKIERNTSCSLVYQCGSPPSDCLGFTLLNPVDGDKTVDIFKLSVKDLTVDYALDQGNNNQIRILVTYTRPRVDPSPTPNLRLGAAPSQRKLKRSRNMLVKASKRSLIVSTL